MWLILREKTEGLIILSSLSFPIDTCQIVDHLESFVLHVYKGFNLFHY